MTVDIDAIAKIVSPIFTLVIGAVIKRYTEARPRLISFLGHVSAFTLQDQNQGQSHVFTHAVVVRNAGKLAAKNVRLGHLNLPINVQVYPHIEHTITRQPDNTGEIVIPSLVPKDQVAISYLYFPPLTWDRINSYTKSDEGHAKIIQTVPLPRPTKPVVALVWSLMFVGASLVVYWAVRLLALLV